jgi:hypothetical protein
MSEKSWTAPQIAFDPLRETALEDGFAANAEMRLTLETSLLALAQEDAATDEIDELESEEYDLDEAEAGLAKTHTLRRNAPLPVFSLRNVVLACGVAVGGFVLLWTHDLVAANGEGSLSNTPAQRAAATLTPVNQPLVPTPLTPPAPLATPLSKPTAILAPSVEKPATTGEEAGVPPSPQAIDSEENPLTAPVEAPIANAESNIPQAPLTVALTAPTSGPSSPNGAPFNPTSSYRPEQPPVEGQPLVASSAIPKNQAVPPPLTLQSGDNSPRRRSQKWPRTAPNNGQPFGERLPWQRKTRSGPEGSSSRNQTPRP